MAKAILLAEDSPDHEALFKLVLEEIGVGNPVMVVRDGIEAIAYLKGEGKFADRLIHPLPDILFLDLKMPRAGGFEVLEWLHDRPSLRNKLLVFVLSSFGDTQAIRRAYDLGANSFLSKPFTTEACEDLIRHFAGYWMRSDTADCDAGKSG